MHLKTRAILGVATVGAAIGAALVPTTSAFAAPGLTVTWANQPLGLNLQDGDTATVSGTGFPASVPVYVTECSTNTGNAADCDTTPSDGGVAVGQTDPQGAFTQAVVVRTETLGSATCGASSTCYIGATTNPNPGGQDATNTGVTSIKFDNLQVAPRGPALKNGQSVNVVGAGFKPNTTNGVAISECTSTDQSKAPGDCDLKSIKYVNTDANGGFTTTFSVHTFTAGDGSSCVAGGTCVVAASDNPLSPTQGTIGAALIKFAALTKTVTKATGPAHVAKGAKFAIKAAVTAGGNGVAGLKVTLYKVKSSGLTKIASGKTGSTGKHKFGGLTQKKTSKYEVKTSANATYAASVSKVVKVATP